MLLFLFLLSCCGFRRGGNSCPVAVKTSLPRSDYRSPLARVLSLSRHCSSRSPLRTHTSCAPTSGGLPASIHPTPAALYLIRIAPIVRVAFISLAQSRLSLAVLVCSQTSDSSSVYGGAHVDAVGGRVAYTASTVGKRSGLAALVHWIHEFNLNVRYLMT